MIVRRVLPLEVRTPVIDSEATLDVARAYQRHRAELRSFFATVARGRASHIEDLVHNVYLRLLEYPPTQVLREPQAYLFKIAWSELHRFHERSLREPQTHDPATLEMLSARGGAFVAAEGSSTSGAEALLTRVMGELPAIYGEVFVKFKWDGRSYKEIATELGLSMRQVKRYIARTLLSLKRARLEEERP